MIEMANKKQLNTLRFLKSEKVKKELTKVQIKSIQKMYKDLAKDVEKEIMKLSNKTVTDRLKKVYLDSYLKELTKETSRINKLVEASAREGILKISQAVIDEAIMKFNIAGGLGVAGLSSKFCHIPTDIVATITSGQLYDSKWSLSSAIWSADKKQHQIIYDTVAKGIAKNASLEEIAKALGDYVSPDRRRVWDMARFYPGNRRKIDYNAMRLVKTINNHAYMESFQRATEHDPFVEAYQWNNGHGPNVCPICEQIAADDMYGLGPGVFPKGDVPLDHPNGQCFITGIQTKSPEEVANAIADWYNGIGDEDLNAELDEFAKDFGYTPEGAKKVAKVARAKNRR